MNVWNWKEKVLNNVQSVYEILKEIIAISFNPNYFQKKKIIPYFLSYCTTLIVFIYLLSANFSQEN